MLEIAHLHPRPRADQRLSGGRPRYQRRGGHRSRLGREVDPRPRRGRRGWRIAHLWYTHAHFDHIGGAAEIADALNPLPLVALHPDDHVLWRAGGGGALFGFKIDPGPEPTIDFEQGQILRLGSAQFEVRYTPGHTPGHCVLFAPKPMSVFAGILIFAGSVGRTDLPGGDWDTLEKSIREQIYTLPDGTRLLSGHGPETTVGDEKQFNPFVRGSTPDAKSFG